jgi:hypothetical protein
MLKQVISVVLGFALVGILGFACRLWLIEKSFDHFNATIQEIVDKKITRLKSSINSQPSLQTFKPGPNSDELHPTVNPNEWDSISNKSQICWIHKKTRKKICEMR